MFKGLDKCVRDNSKLETLSQKTILEIKSCKLFYVQNGT